MRQKVWYSPYINVSFKAVTMGGEQFNGFKKIIYRYGKKCHYDIVPQSKLVDRE